MQNLVDGRLIPNTGQGLPRERGPAHERSGRNRGHVIGDRPRLLLEPGKPNLIVVCPLLIHPYLGIRRLKARGLRIPYRGTLKTRA